MVQDKAAAAQKKRIAPYPGLRPFSRRESSVFFGRDRLIDGMAATLQERRFLAVLGPSGSGKSSLVRSGLFEHLEAGLARKAGSRWRFLDIKHPRTQPYRELAKVTIHAERWPPDGVPPEPLDEELKPTPAEIDSRALELRRGPLALLKWWLAAERHPEENLLLLVDQFEELFGYTTVRERDEVESFIDLLLHTAAHPDLQIYVVLTMRSEFLGGCSLFPGLAEQINRSLSLTPRMTREECELAIKGPAYTHKGVDLEPALVNALLNDMNSLAKFDEGEPAAGAVDEEALDAAAAELRQADLIARRADQLPLMQHVLNWMWSEATRDAEQKGDGSAKVMLRLDDYRTALGLRGALSKHANRVMGDDPDDIELTSRIFRALTDQPSVATRGSVESTAVRRLRTIAQLAEEAEASEEQVRAIVERFRADGVSMLTPDPSEKLTSSTEIDISHESIIRQWDSLRGWIRDEAEAGRNWQELVRNVDKRIEERRWLAGLDLSDRLNWWNQSRPRPAWSERYGGQHQRVDEFLRLSEGARRRRKLGLYGGVAAVVAAGVVSFGATQVARADAEERTARARVELEYAADETRRALRAAGEAEMRGTAAQRAAALAAEAVKRAKVDQERAAASAADAAAASAEARRLMGLADAARIESLARLREQQLESARVGQEMAGFWRPQIEEASAQAPFAAERTLAGIEAKVEVLRNASPDEHAALRRDIQRAKGDVAFYSFDAAALTKLSENVEKQADEADTADHRALLLSRAAGLEARAAALRGDSKAAVEHFTRALKLPPSGPPEVTLARLEAQAALATALLDHGDKSEAARVAKECVDSDRSSASSDSTLAEAVADGAGRRPPAVRTALARCRTVLGATAASEADAMRQFNNAAALLDGDEHRPERAVANAELLIRFFGRIRAIDQNALDALGGPVLATMAPFYGEGGGQGGSLGGANAGRNVVPFEALQRVRATGAMLDWFLRRGPSAGQELEDVAMILDGVDALLNAISETGTRGFAGDLPTSIAAAYRLQTANRARFLHFINEGNYARNAAHFPAALSAVSDEMQFVLNHEVAQEEERIEKIRLDALGALRQSAKAVLWERYGDPLAVLETAPQLVEGLCRPFDSPSATCTELAGAAGAIERAGRAALAKARAPAIAGGNPYWTDGRGVALDGIDLVACEAGVGLLGLSQARARLESATTAAELADVQDQRAQTSGEIIEDSAEALPTCRARRGSLAYAYGWKGAVWLFERKDNLERFAAAPERYAPRLGGYDVLALAAGEGRLVRPGTGVAVLQSGDRIYLLEHEFGTLTAQDLENAERNWLRLKAQAAQPAPPAAAAADAAPGGAR